MAYLTLNLNKKTRGKLKSFPLFFLSVAAAGDKHERDKNEPDIIVFKKVAKTVIHKCSVSAI